MDMIDELFVFYLMQQCQIYFIRKHEVIQFRFNFKHLRQIQFITCKYQVYVGAVAIISFCT